MRTKHYKMRSLAEENGLKKWVELDLEFEGRRAFVVWDSIPIRGYLLKARVEIDPELLQAGTTRSCDFFYRGSLVLPRAEHN
jgi:hypothetical protein